MSEIIRRFVDKKLVEKNKANSVDKRPNGLVRKIFQRIQKKNISCVDCSILSAMKTEGIKKLLTFDREDCRGPKGKRRFEFYGS